MAVTHLELCNSILDGIECGTTITSNRAGAHLGEVRRRGNIDIHLSNGHRLEKTLLRHGA